MEVMQPSADARRPPSTEPRARPGPARDARPATAPSRLVMQHFLASTLYLVAGALGLVWIAPELAHGMYLAPRVAGVTHLFTLGWLTLTILGALGQLLPMALGAPIRSLRLARASFWTLAPGVGLFAVGVATAIAPLLVLGVACVALGVTLAVAHVAATLAGGRSRDATWTAVALGIAFLASTLALGLVLSDNLHTGLVASARVRILAAHFHVAVVGWAMIIVVGVSRRLLPMFLVAHAADARWTRRALIALALGVPVLATGLVAAIPPASWAGAALLDLGVAAFLWQALLFYRNRTRPTLDVGMRFVAAGLPFFGAAAIVGPIVLALGGAHGRWGTAYVVAGLLGGFVPFVTGFAYEIVPTLAWTARFAGRLNRGRVPSVAELYSRPLAMAQLTMCVGGVVLMLAGIATAVTIGVRAGAMVFLIAALVFCYQIARMWWGPATAPRSSPISR